jgi:hypothetical protein
MDNKIYFDIEVFYQDWIFISNLDNNFNIIHNNKKQLKEFINSHSDYWFVGFNNYHYDDYILSDIINGNNPYLLSKTIIEKSSESFYKLKYPIYLNYKSLDLIQDIEKENGKRISLKKIMANLGLNIIESEISFDVKRKLTKIEIENTIKYCSNDVIGVKEFFKYRESYFNTKLILIKDFNLPMLNIRLNENNLVAKILNCRWTPDKRNYLCFNYVNKIDFNLIPKEIIDFYTNMEKNYINGYGYNESIKMCGINGKLKTKLLNVDTTYGIGGLHGCNKLKKYDGNIMLIDVSSYYPTLMINNNFYSHSFGRKDLYKQIYDKRIELKKIDVKKANAYKLILNKPIGCMRSNMIMRDYQNGNNIIVNGQLILTQLIIELKDYINLIQINTDGIAFKYNYEDKSTILKIINDFENRFTLKFSVEYIDKLYQKDVNNYILKKSDGKIKAKGQNFKNFERNQNEFMNNSRSIIDICRYEYFINNVPISKTIRKCYDNNEIYRFQLITTYGKTYDFSIIEYDGNYYKLTQKVNRVFATTDSKCGYIYKCRKVKKQKHYNTDLFINGDSYKIEKMPNCYNHCLIFNDDVNLFDKSKLDLNYYEQLCSSNL